MSKPRVFIGSSQEGIKVAEAVQENLGDMEATPWKQGVFMLSKPTISSLMDCLGKVDFAIFVFSPDDLTNLRGVEFSTVRDNVIYETGLFSGRLGAERVFIVVPEDYPNLHLPTDLAGVTIGSYDAKRTDQNLIAATGTFCSQVRRAINAQEPFMNELESIGIVNASPRLDFSAVRKKIASAKERVIISENWICEDDLKDLDREFNRTKAPITVILLNPYSQWAIQRNRDLRRDDGKSTTVSQSITHNITCLEEIRKGRPFDLRVHSCLPTAQLFIVDDWCLISFYFLDTLAHNSPQIVLNLKETEFGSAIENHISYLTKHSCDVKDLHLDAPCQAIHHVSLPVTNLEASVNFYENILGLRKIYRPHDHFKFPGEWFEFPSGQQLHLVYKPKEKGSYRKEAFADKHLSIEQHQKIGPDIHFAIKVDNDSYNEIRRRAIENKINISYEIYMKEQMYITDPDNHMIELAAWVK